MTHIPDEAVQAAETVLRDAMKTLTYTKTAKAVIEATLPYLSAPYAVEVKKLEWVDYPAGGVQALAAGLALYRVHANGDDWYMVPDHMGKGGKAAAQADFERRVRECHVATDTNDGAKHVDVAAVRRQVLEEAARVVATKPMRFAGQTEKTVRDTIASAIRTIPAEPAK